MIECLILKGKKRNRQAIVHQFCNDWFTLEGERFIYSPAALAFTMQGMNEIQNSKCGELFVWYTLRIVPNKGKFTLSFRKKKVRL